MRVSLKAIYQLLPPGLFHLQGQSLQGWQPTLKVSWFLLAPFGLFHRDPKLTPITRTWYHLDSFIVTRDFSALCRDWQKPRHRDADANSIKPPGRQVL
jgi:hypothetical protein